MACCMEGINKLLMPKEGSYTKDWAGFGPPAANSLLVVGHIRLEVGDLEATRRFLCSGLGVAVEPGRQPNEIEIAIGATTLIFSAVSTAGRPPRSWVSQLYVWVDDIRAVQAACQRLQEQIGDEVIISELCLKDGNSDDVLVLAGPTSDHVFMVNRSPKGYARMAESADVLKSSAKRQNIIAVLDIQCSVPLFAAIRIVRFYRRLLSVSVHRIEGGCRVDFAAGPTIRQSVTFKEEKEEGIVHRGFGQEGGLDQVCIYMPSEVKFQLAYQECSRAGIVTMPASASEVGRLKEFSFQKVIDPETDAIVLHLAHLVRSPSHPDCPVDFLVCKEASDGA